MITNQTKEPGAAPSDEALRETLQRTISRYGGEITRLCYLRLRSMQDAEDAAQDTFCRYVERLRQGGGFESEEHEKAWLLRVALNQCGKTRRSAWNRRRDAAEWKPEAVDGGNFPQASPATPEEQALRREEAGEVLRAVLALPVKYREVIHLFYYEDLSVREIAEILNRRESTVTAQLSRGRAMLRKLLKEEAIDFA